MAQARAAQGELEEAEEALTRGVATSADHGEKWRFFRKFGAESGRYDALINAFDADAARLFRSLRPDSERSTQLGLMRAEALRNGGYRTQDVLDTYRWMLSRTGDLRGWASLHDFCRERGLYVEFETMLRVAQEWDTPQPQIVVIAASTLASDVQQLPNMLDELVIVAASEGLTSAQAGWRAISWKAESGLRICR